MAYTPELSDTYSATLRRIAWAINQPMTKAITTIIEAAVERSDKSYVCSRCKDNTRCGECLFNTKQDNHITEQGEPPC